MDLQPAVSRGCFRTITKTLGALLFDREVQPRRGTESTRQTKSMRQIGGAAFEERLRKGSQLLRSAPLAADTPRGEDPH